MSFHFKFDTLGEMLKEIALSIRPKERMSVSQAAAKYRQLREATHRGHWDNSIAPYLVDIMDEMESLEHDIVCFVGPARCGKSDIFFNWLAYANLCDPGDMMVIHMTQATSRDWSQSDLRKALRHSTALGNEILPGRQNVNTEVVRFKSMRLLVKWPSITEVSGKTLRRTWIMDHDRIENVMNIEGEGALIDLTAKRTTTYGRHGMSVVESSPGYPVKNHRWLRKTPHEAPPCEGILSIYNRGDRRRWYWFCAGCEEAFEPSFSLLNWPQDEVDHAAAAKMATLDCPHCGFSHTHDADPSIGQPGKYGLNLRGRWVKDGQKLEKDGTITGKAYTSSTASFWLKGVAAAFVTWEKLVLKYLKAMEDYERTGDYGSLIATTNTDQGEPWTPPKLEGDRTPEMIKGRAINWPKGFVPLPVRYLTATIDVQRNRFVVQVHGHGVGNDKYLIDRFDIRKSERLDADGDRLWIAPHAQLDDWKLLVPQVIEKTYPLADSSGRHMRIKAVACDSGGKEGVTSNAYDFWRWLRDEHPAQHHRRFQLLKGTASPSAPRVVITFPDAEKKDRRAAARGEVPVMLLQTNLMKDQVDGLLDRKQGFGRIYFPDWLDDEFFVELTVEVKTTKGWENPKKLRNETWDLLVYDYALGLVARHINVTSLDWDDPPLWAEEWDANILVFRPEQGLPFETKPKAKKLSLEELAEALG